MHIKKLLSVSLALVLSLSFLAACSGSSSSSAAAPAPSGAASASQPAEGNGEQGTDSGEVTTLSVWINHPWYFTDVFEGIIPEAITAATGVKLDVTRAVDYSQLGLMIASGELPDLIFTDQGADQALGRLSSADLCYSYNELIEQYCPEWQPDPVRISNATAFSNDDNYYFLHSAYTPESEWADYPGIPGLPTMAYRADILEALGNPPMETIDDFLAVLPMVKEQYPDMIPLATNTTALWRFAPFRVWTGAGNDLFIEDENGDVKFITNRPEYKDFLKLMNQMYQDGYISADNLSLSDPDSTNLWQTGQAFAFTHTSTGQTYMGGQMAKALDPNVEVAEVAPMGDGKYHYQSIGWAGTFITKNCENPEAAIKLVEFLFSDEGQKLSQWGREGTEWTMGDDGYPVFSEDWLAASDDQNLLYTTYNPAFYFGTSAAVESVGRLAVLPEDYRSVYQEIKPQIVHEPWMGLAMPSGDSDETTTYLKLSDLWTNTEVQVILSADDAEFEANYEKYVADANQMGAEAIEDYIQARVAELK